MRTRALVGVVSVLVLVLGGLACGTVLGIDDDAPAPVEPPPVVVLPDAADFPEGSVVYLDGAVVLPDGAVVDGATSDSAVADSAIADSATADTAQPDTSMPPGCPGIAACPRYVFVTSDVVPYAIAEPASAAAHCQTLAGASSNLKIKVRQFDAWTSTTASPASTRLVHGTMAYRNVLNNGVVANNWTDLTDGTLTAALFHDENGAAVSAPAVVWTGTSAAGNVLAPNCADWTDLKGTAVRGALGATTSNWSVFAGNDVSCGSTAHLYCIEK